MVHHDKLACINLVPLFKSLSEAQKQEIATLIHEKKYPKDTIIYLRGDEVGHFMIVNRGQIKITQTAANGKEQLLKVLTPGDFDGEASLFNGNQRSANAVALVDSSVCQIDQSQFQALLTKQPELAVNMMQIMSKKIEGLEEEKTVSATTNVAGQLARYLLETSAALNQVEFKLPLKKKDIAVYLGTTPETISRTLKKMAQDQLITASYATIKILDEDGLTLLV